MKYNFFRVDAAFLSVVMGLGFFSLSSVSHAEEDGSPPEVLVFVDVSGSMIKNDPKNMRAPAIRMLAGMAPEDARVGIYLFGTKVRELVAPGKVNHKWKDKAEKASSRFLSRDMYTNIEAALKTANKNWSNNKNAKRSIILLTDGIVDIDKNKDVSVASRKRILNSILPELKEMNVNVNTIALSKNADHDLLQQLAFQSDGKNQQVDNAESLQRTFMHLFEQSAPQDTLSLAGNIFTVDTSISELTLLIFRKPDSEATQIITPEGETYTQSYSVDGLSWKHDTGYDLISVSHPIAGEWKIVADEDPDNRAMIVTDLKLRANEVPVNVLNGESLDWVVWLENKGKVVNKAEFLKLISATLSSIKDGSVEQSWTLQSANESGQFLHRLGSEWETGTLELLLKIDGGTFAREKRISINAYTSPIEIHADIIDDETFKDLSAKRNKKISENVLSSKEMPEINQGWKIDIKAMKELIDLSASEIFIEAKSQSDQVTTLVAEKSEQGWTLNFLPEEVGQHRIAITFTGKSLTGREITTQIKPLLLGEVVTVLEPAVIEENQSEKIPSMKEFIIPVVLGNILFLLLFLGWKFLKRLRENAMLQPEETL